MKIKKIFNKIKNNDFKKENKINLKFLNGTKKNKDDISPSYINLNNPKYIEIDNIYYSGIIITNYYREYLDLLLKNIIDSNINMNISIFYEKQDTYKTIKDLTYYIGNVGVELENKNNQDIDIASFTYNDAKYIRKQIQIDNEDLYFLYIYLTVFSEDLKELEYFLNKVDGILQSSGMQTRRANFRQEQLFLSCSPLMLNNEDVKRAARRNVLSSGLVATYPFVSSTIFDEKGIYIGNSIYNNSLIFIDKYNTEKYKNANMCVFGTSGSRKIIFYKTTGIEV